MSEIIYVQEDNKKRKATTEELKQMSKDQAEAELNKSIVAAEAEAKATARAELLKRLGITAEEAQLLLS
jgi:hypothetical protein